MHIRKNSRFLPHKSLRPHLCLSNLSLSSLLCPSLIVLQLHSTLCRSSTHCSCSRLMTWLLALQPKMIFFKIFTQLTVSHSSNLDSYINSSEKVFPHSLAKAALLCPTQCHEPHFRHKNRNYLMTGTIDFMSFTISLQQRTMSDTY